MESAQPTVTLEISLSKVQGIMRSLKWRFKQKKPTHIYKYIYLYTYTWSTSTSKKNFNNIKMHRLAGGKHI